MKAKHGWDSFYYGNASTPRPPAPRPAPGGRGGAACTNLPPPPEGVMREWQTFEHVPRFHNNYVGLRNRFALLSEAYAYATFEDRIKATSYFLDASLDFASRNAAKLKKAIADADRARLAGTTLSTSAKMTRGQPIDILMGEVEVEKNPINDADMCRRKDATRVEKMVDMRWFEPAATATVPAAYYVPANAVKALALLKMQGVQMREVALPNDVEAFAIDGNTVGQIFEGHVMRKLEGRWAVKVRGGAAERKYWEVRTNQPLGRLAFYLLEPTSDDGLVAWNALDDQLKPGAAMYPILRSE
jgi:hypothetical protein